MTTPAAGTTGRWYGSLLILVAGITLYNAHFIRTRTVTGSGDPGPRFLPITLAIVLGVGGVMLIIGSLLRRTVPSQEIEPRKTWREMSRDRGNIDTALLLATLPIYLVAMSALGFFLCTWVYAAAIMYRLGMRLLMSLLISTAMMLMVWVLFVRMFRIVLPAGPSWLPF